MGEWLKLTDEMPQYYSPVKMKIVDGSVKEIWRASYGEGNVFTEIKTEHIISESDIISWEKEPIAKFMSLSCGNLMEDSIQHFLGSHDLPLHQERIERGTDKLDRPFYYITWHGTIVGYFIVTVNNLPYDEGGVLKYDSVHINQIELLDKYQKLGLGREAIKVLGNYFKSDGISKLTIVGKNDYLDLYYKSIGFKETRGGLLIRTI